jgi:hypothetical protein
MPFPLGTVLSAAPGVISAAADIIRVIKENKTKQAHPEELVQPESDKLAELNRLIERHEELIERQAEVIEDLAENNRNLALAVRNNRILSAGSLAIALTAIALSLVL